MNLTKMQKTDNNLLSSKKESKGYCESITFVYSCVQGYGCNIIQLMIEP